MKSHSKHLLRRTLSLLLMCAMVLSLLPAATLAAGRFRDEEPVVEIPAETNFETGESRERPAQPLEFIEPAADLAAADSVTYYVSTSGKGGNSGLTADDPLPGLDAVPWSQLLPGDSVLLKKGDTFPGTIRMVNIHGTADSPVTVGTYGTGAAPVIEARGQGIWLRETGSTVNVGKYASAGVMLYDCSYVNVSGLEIVNVPDALKTSFQDISGASDALGVSDHSGEKLPYAGVAVAADAVGAAEGITLSNITVRGDSAVQTVMTETSSTVTKTNVTKGATASARTYTNASGTYYVSSLNGSDSNPGTSPDKAFYSLHKINELNLQPGTKVYLEYGSVFENQYLHIEGGGTAGNPVIFDAYGKESNGKPLMNTNGNGVWYQNYRKNLDNGGHLRQGYVSSSILIYDVEYLEVKNIAMTNGGHYGETPGADFDYLGSYDGGTVPGEIGYVGNDLGAVGAYTWNGKMCRTGVAGVSQNVGTMDHVYLQNLDIENVYGNVAHKHMCNGGIYFTVAAALNEASTGIPKIDDLRIEGCYLKHVSRWGIAAAYTGAYWNRFTSAAISDEACQTYGVTNMYIGHNYLEEVGGDPITAMYAYEPLIEYNVSYNGGREMAGKSDGPNYIDKDNHIYGNPGDVSAGIWPWKCKTALFEHNECYTMLYGDLGGNGDCQAWDADYGDSTIYQYNYSSGNTGGCIMFCYSQAYNTVFRYNISYKDGVSIRGGNNQGVIDMSSNPNGQISNNTFIMAEGTPVSRSGHNGEVHIENNIFYNLGSAYNALWDRNDNHTFNNNLYAGFSTTASNDSKKITVAKDTLFADPTFAEAYEVPATTSKAGLDYTEDGIRNWARDWDTDFDMFKLKDATNAAVNAGVPHNYNGLTQDSNFGVPRVANDKDFYGNELDEVHDIGAHDTQTATPAVPSSECALVSSLYELRGNNSRELQVPFDTDHPLTVENFAKGLKVSKGATVKVYNGTTEQSATDPVAENMTVKIVAENGTESSTVYTIRKKNTYNSYADWVGNQQGNTWFYQYWSDGKFVDHTEWDGTWSCWGGGSGVGYASVERDQACGSVDEGAGSGFTFRAPAGGKVTVSLGYYANSTFTEGQVKKRGTGNEISSTTTLKHYIRVYLNGENQADKAVLVPNEEGGTATVQPMTFTVDQGDTLSFVAYNGGEYTVKGGNHGIFFTPVVTYANEAYTPSPDTQAPTAPGSVAASKITETTATVTWAASTDNEGVDHYEVTVGDNEPVNVTELKMNLTELTAGTEYTVTVVAVDEVGNESTEASVTFTTLAVDDTPPAAPTNGQVVGTPTSTTATVKWTASTSDDVVGYKVTVGSKEETVRNATQITLTGLSAETNYTANVVAVDGAGNESSQALEIAFTTGAADSVPPTDPTGLIVANITDASAAVRWTASTDAVGVTGYEIGLSQNDDDVQDVGNYLQYILTGLTHATTYTAYVRAYDEAGNRSGWAQVEFTTSASRECEIFSTLFELRGDNKDELQVPYTANNPTTVEELGAAFEVSEGASVKVYEADGTTEVTGNVAEGMVVKVVAADGVSTNTKVYTIKQKNVYDHLADWVNGQHGNVWFAQYRLLEDEKFYNWTGWGSGNPYGWWGGGANNNNAVAEAQHAGDDVGTAANRKYIGSGFTFRAPVSGNVGISFSTQPKFRATQSSGNQFDTYVIVYVNGEQVEGQKTLVPKGGGTNSANIADFTLSVDRGDNIQFMVVNEGDTRSFNNNSNGVTFTPVVTYLDEEFVPGPGSVVLNKTDVTLYTNTGAGLEHTVQLTATVLPEEAEAEITWSSGNEEVATVSADGVVTAQGNGDTYIRATATGKGETVTAECQVHVYTRIETITVKKDGTDIGDIKLYTNTGDSSLTHSVTLTAETAPANVSHPTLNWTIPNSAEIGRVTLVRNSNGSVTLTATSNELKVGEVTVQVASAEHPEIKTTFKVNVTRKLENDVTISGTPKFGQKLLVNLNQLSMSAAGIEGLTYQWKRDGEAIQGADEVEYTLVKEDIDKTISVEVTADESTFYEGVKTASVEVTRADNTEIPSGLTALNCTDGDNGQITGLDAAKVYEYKLAGADQWTPLDEGATTIENLPAGNYQVRFAQTETHEAGANAATVTIMGVDAEPHTITIDSAVVGGVITIGASQAEEGDEVTVSATANPGYTLKDDSLKVTYTDENSEEQTVEVTEGKFTMPAANVTVSAEFEAVELELGHNITNIRCDLVDHDHKVEYGQALDIQLTAEEGYTMPFSITVYKADGTTLFTDYLYIHTVDDPDQAIVRFAEGAITENLTISGEGVMKSFVVHYALENGLDAPEETAPRSVNYRQRYEGTLVAEEGYGLPESIIVTMGGALIGSKNFSYNSETGKVIIYEGRITGDVVITASGVDTRVPVISVTGVNLVREQVSVAKNATITLVAEVRPANATNSTVVWSSSDPEVASVDQNGVVTGVSVGSAVITVVTVDGRHTDTCRVSVTDPTGTKPPTSTSTSTPTTTTTEVKEDGTKVTTETKPDGTKVETVEEPDGTKAVTETKPDGSKTATVEQPDGTKSETVVTAEGDATITVTDPEGEELVKAEIPAEIPAPETKFEDIDQTPWAEEAINKVAGLELVKGVGGNKYDPTTPMTRGALATVLHRLSNGKTDYKVAFKDVQNNKYYTEGVAWAAKAKVVTGYTTEIFAPDDIITREQLAVMMVRYAKLIGMDTKADAKSLDTFVDGEDTGAWAVDGVAWCVEKGILKGKGLNNLDPTANVSRAEVAVMLDRFIALIQK